MNSIETAILQAATELRLPTEAFHRCDETEANAVIMKAKEVFVVDDPRSWWLSLKLPCTRHDYASGGPELLRSYIPATERRCWFIPETEEAQMPVFECDVDLLVPVVNQCFFFEYYVVGKQFDWLLIDTDHNQIVLCYASVQQ